MFEQFKDILIVTSTGKLIASKIEGPEIQEEHFAMLFSALNSYTEKIFNEKLNKIEMNNLSIYFLKKENFIFIATTTVKNNASKIQKELEKLSEFFFSKYPPESLKTWNGTHNIFSNFEIELNKKMKDSIEDFFLKCS